MNLHKQNFVCWPSVGPQDIKQTYIHTYIHTMLKLADTDTQQHQSIWHLSEDSQPVHAMQTTRLWGSRCSRSWCCRTSSYSNSVSAWLPRHASSCGVGVKGCCCTGRNSCFEQDQATQSICLMRLQAGGVWMAHPQVAEAVAFGYPDKKNGGIVAAAVVLNKPVSDTAAFAKDLQKQAGQQMAAFKVRDH